MNWKIVAPWILAVLLIGTNIYTYYYFSKQVSDNDQIIKDYGQGTKTSGSTSGGKSGSEEKNWMTFTNKTKTSNYKFKYPGYDIEVNPTVIVFSTSDSNAEINFLWSSDTTNSATDFQNEINNTKVDAFSSITEEEDLTINNEPAKKIIGIDLYSKEILAYYLIHHASKNGEIMYFKLHLPENYSSDHPTQYKAALEIVDEMAKSLEWI